MAEESTEHKPTSLTGLRTTIYVSISSALITGAEYMEEGFWQKILRILAPALGAVIAGIFYFFLLEFKDWLTDKKLRTYLKQLEEEKKGASNQNTKREIDERIKDVRDRRHEIKKKEIGTTNASS
nr:hypothetical protein [uncultured Arsenicibacter sp.]